MIWQIALGYSIAAALGASAAYWYFRRFENLPHQEALRRAIKIGFEIWSNSDFDAPGKLTIPDLGARALREAGLVLKAEIVGDSTYGYKMAQDAAKPHPELATVDPLDIAKGVRQLIREGIK